MHRGMRFTLRPPILSSRNANRVGALALFLSMASSAPAQRLPLPPQEQEEVNNAIDRGVAYLKRTQQKNGTWANPRGNWAEARFHGHYYAIGFTALPALTLLECGVPANDPIIQQAAHFLRSKAAQLDRTYELSLAILFLDRLGDPSDKKIIQTFALRLIAGQSATGGWGYKCPLLSSKTQTELLTALRHLHSQDDMPAIAQRHGKKLGELTPTARVPGAPAMEGTIAQPDSSSLSGSISRGSSDEPPSLSVTTVEGSPGESLSPKESSTESPKRRRDCLGLALLDEKNPETLDTDLQMPADEKPSETKPNAKADPRKSSQRYVIPERIKRLPVMQNPAMPLLQDPLNRPNDTFLTTTDNSNTQFAILALWRAQQYDVPTKRSLDLIVRRYLTSQNADGSWGYHYQYGGGSGPIRLPNAMTCVGLIGLAVGHGLAQPKRAGQPVQDARIINGLIALSESIGQPVEHRGKPAMQNLYYLWSLERVAVLYNLPTIGDKDWYRWGAQILVRNQQSEGNWAGGLYIGSKTTLDTCLALLFLKRANPVKDLAAKLPFSAEDLNLSIMEKLAPPPPKQSDLPKKTKKASTPIELPKPSEPDKVALNSPPPPENTVGADNAAANTGSSKKIWIAISAVFFVIFSGGSLFFILLALSRRKQAEAEEGQSKRKKRSFSREPKARASRSPSARG
jgi:hypothetical protein